MNCLLDTSAFLWYVSAHKDLSSQAKTIIADSNNSVYLSLASIWEIAIKFRAGKLELAPSPFSAWIDHELASNSFRLLDIKVLHLKRVAELPLAHRDPFDRLLIAQSLVEDLPIITNDRTFDTYQVQRIW